MLDITLPARAIFHIGPIPITDAFLGAVLTTVFLTGFLYLASNKFTLIPTRIQLVLEMISEYILSQLKSAFGTKERAEAFLPFFITMLLFLVIANQVTLLPFIFEITYEGGDLFRQPTSDLAQPLALSLVIFFISHAMAIKINPIKHLSNFISIGPLLQARSVGDVFNAGIAIFVGLLNIAGELAKVISLAARLFGNIFAGNVMVAVIMSLAAFTQFIVPLPFIILSVFSGFVQAFVFMLLSIQFIALTIDGAKTEPKTEGMMPEKALI